MSRLMPVRHSAQGRQGDGPDPLHTLSLLGIILGVVTLYSSGWMYYMLSHSLLPWSGHVPASLLGTTKATGNVIPSSTGLCRCSKFHPDSLLDSFALARQDRPREICITLTNASAI